MSNTCQCAVPKAAIPISKNKCEKCSLPLQAKARTFESWMMIHAKPGDQFFSSKTDRHLSAIAYNYKRKIKTQRMAAVGVGFEDVEAVPIVRVTFL